MYKVRQYLFFLVAIVSATTFAACSSEEEVSGSEERGVVKTEFTISFPQQMSGTTRMSTTVVQGQASPVFRGISSIELRPFMEAASAVTSSTQLPSPIRLTGGTSYAKSGASGEGDNIIAAANALYSGSNSHLYKDISINIGTRSFMFYGVATDQSVASGVRPNAVNGALTRNTTTPTGTLTDISFSPTQIYTSETEGTQIATYLTDIANATVGDKKMTDIFPNFTTLTAGSWTNVKVIAQAIYTSIKDNQDALSTEIKNKILVAATDDTEGNLTFNKTPYNAFTYPRNIGLPDGAAHVKWIDAENKFTMITTDNLDEDISTLDSYAYPASLYYWGLSDIRTSEASVTYGDDNNWSQILALYPTGAGVVQPNTRSIAIIKPVEYAVGRLDVTVKTKNGASTLQDNANHDITVGTNFPVTGILIGNQRAVDYKFETKTGETKTYTIYDGQIETTNSPRLYPGTNPDYITHTLVLETPTATSAEDANANVPIAIEFENNSDKIIVGKDNLLIYPGTKFYMMGTLKPFNNNVVKYTGTETLIKKAFVQDYVTKANFVVADFKKAYNALPDMRKPSLEIGLSVDLTWKTGITQEIDIE
ncbi:MAG: hypothetical protein IJ544_07860 [Prevotella sp.]|nr:hypothetical protein [Prevotella sp.]